MNIKTECEHGNKLTFTNERAYASGEPRFVPLVVALVDKKSNISKKVDGNP